MNKIEKLKMGVPSFWVNPEKQEFNVALKGLDISDKEVIEASERLRRFEPYLKQAFELDSGIIESELTEIKEFKNWYSNNIIETKGDFYLKRDDLLPVAGSIKARGGVYEVLKHAEALLINEGLLSYDDDYSKILQKECIDFLSKYTIQVGSTGNLGLSIGTISARLGFKVIVHMSSDAKKWKKDLLRNKGVTVIEYEQDYSKAVEAGREASDKDPLSYFVDDENSIDLFLGYAVGGYRLKQQLERKDIHISKEKPLFVYLPCGVGGGPGGVAYGIKLQYGDDAHIYFSEPTQSPAMLYGLISKKYGKANVSELGLTNKTEADGLAVGTPSELVSRMMELILDGEATVEDKELFKYIKALYKTEGIFIEPSAAAGFEIAKYIKASRDAVHIFWATGGGLVPEDVREEALMKN